MLRSAGIRSVHAVADPRQAAQQSLDVGADLVLLDWHLPGMGGLEVLQALRAALPPHEFVPVIVLTGDNTTAVRDQALAMGAKDFLVKPLDLTEVMLRIRNLLETRALHREVQRHNEALKADLDRRIEKDREHAALQEERLRRIDAVLAGTSLGMEFQPIANLQTRQRLGVEALARFRSRPHRRPDEWFR